MNEINLLRYHNRSAHEIHMLLNGELTDEFFSRIVTISSKKVKKVRLSRLTFFMTLLLAFLCSLVSSYFIYTKLLPHKDLTSVNGVQKHIIEVMSVKIKPKAPEKPDPLLKEGYARIGELDDKAEGKGSQGLLIISDYKPETKADTGEKPEEIIKPITVPGEPAKRIPVREPDFMPLFSGNFKIQFFNLNEQELSYVKTLAQNNDLTLTQIGSDKIVKTKWLVYLLDNTSPVTISGRRVRYIKSYSSSDAAMSYLTRNSLKGLITTDTSVTNFYDMQVCCLSEEAADKLARGSGVGMDKVKILKDQQ